MQQIKNLVERGKTREEIAEILEVTLGSLAVTCSKLGISLRRPRLDQPPPKKMQAPPKEPPLHLQFKLQLVLHSKGRQRAFDLPVAAINMLLMEAAFSDQSIANVIGQVLLKSLEEL
jgi:hypothetical protein